MADVPISLYTSVVKLTGENVAPPSLPPSLEETQPAINPPGTSDISGLVPYNGAIDDVNLGEKGLSTGFVQYDTTPTDTPTGSGTVVWNPDKYTLDLSMGLGDSVQQIGMETYYTPVKNQTGSLIPDGTFVMATGSLGASGRITVAPAVTDGSVDSRYMLGVTTHDIANGGDGLVTWFGEIRGFNTNTKAPVGETWVDGTVLWNNPAVAGGFTSVEPQAPNLKIPVAIVISSGNNGVIFVRPRLGMRLTDLHDVDAFTPSDKDLISYDSALGHWNAKSLGSVIGGTSSQFLKGDGSLDSNAYALASSISGTTNYLSKFTGSGTIGDSAVFESGGNVGIGTTNPLNATNFVCLTLGDNSASKIGLLQLRSSYNSGNGAQLYQNTSGDIFFNINSTTVGFNVKSSGNFLIGTTTDSGQKLQVAGNIALRASSTASAATQIPVFTADPASTTRELVTRTPAQLLGDAGGVSGSGTTNYLAKFTASGTVGNSNLINDASGNLGLGVTPSAWNIFDKVLQVGAASLVNYQNTDNTFVGSNVYYGGSPTNFRYITSGVTATLYRMEAGAFKWLTAPSGTAGNAISFTQAMTLTSAGNLGIGTTAPTNTLDVNGTGRIRNGVTLADTSGNVLIGTTTDSGGKFQVSGNGKFIGSSSQTLDIGTSTGVSYIQSYGSALAATPLLFYTGITERMRITSDGNLGLGITTPTTKLHVVHDNATVYTSTGSIFAPAHISNISNSNTTVGASSLQLFSIAGDAGTSIVYHGGIGGGVNTSGVYVIGRRTGSQNYAESLRIDASGKVGIGTTSPTNTLDVNGTARIRTLSGTTGYLPLLSSTGVMGQSVAYNAGTGIVINGTTLPTGAVLSVNGVSFFNNFATAGAYDKLSIDFGENRGFGYDPTPNEIFVKGTTTVPVKIDTDAPTDSLNVLSTGGIKMANIPSGTIANAVGLDSNNELVKISSFSSYKLLDEDITPTAFTSGTFATLLTGGILGTNSFDGATDASYEGEIWIRSVDDAISNFDLRLSIWGQNLDVNIVLGSGSQTWNTFVRFRLIIQSGNFLLTGQTVTMLENTNFEYVKNINHSNTTYTASSTSSIDVQARCLGTGSPTLYMTSFVLKQIA